MKTDKPKTYIIAEVGPNHNGDVNLALKMVERLAKVGVDAIKFQITIPENAYSLDAFKADYQEKQENSKSPLEMSKKYSLSFEDHKKVYEECVACQVDYICSAFEMESLKFIDSNFSLAYYKIPSGEIFSVDLIAYMSQKNKPIILSTGIATRLK